MSVVSPVTPTPVAQAPLIDISIRNRYSEMIINGQVVNLNQSNRVSLNLEGNEPEIRAAVEALLSSLPPEWAKLKNATDMVVASPLQDEFGSGGEPEFILSLSVRQKLTRHDEVGDDDDVEIDDDLEEGEEA